MRTIAVSPQYDESKRAVFLVATDNSVRFPVSCVAAADPANVDEAVDAALRVKRGEAEVVILDPCWGWRMYASTADGVPC